MKKITLLFLLFSVLSITEIFAQSDFYTCIPSDGSTSGNARAPHGRYRYQRGVILITSAEMATSGITNGNVINSIAFNYLVAQNITTSGTMTLYLENTSDVTNLKSLTWATAITGMTTVSNGAVTVQNSVGNAVYNFSGGSPFTYTGGGVYVAFDYQNAANPLPTSFVTVDCNSTGLAGGFKGAQSDSAAPTTIAASNFRPVILLGKSVTCARPTNLSAIFANNTFNSADLTWTASGGANVDFQYGLYGFTLGSGTTNTSVTSPYTLGGLLPNTVYQYYVRTNCGSGFSIWNGPYSFTTRWDNATPPYNTGFEQEVFPFVGWVAIPDSNTPNSWFINFGGTGSTLVQEGQYSAAAITPTATAATQELYSRGINLNAGASTTISYYDFNYVSDNPASTNTASYTLTVGTGLTPATQTTTLNTTTGLNTSAFTLRTVTFTPSTTGVYYFRFTNNSPANPTGTHAIIIDNFTVTQALSNSEFFASTISVYPNPTKNIINFSNSLNAIIENVVLTDLNGRVVKTQKINATEGQVSISDLSTGVYMMRIITDQGTATKKIVRE